MTTTGKAPVSIVDDLRQGRVRPKYSTSTWITDELAGQRGLDVEHEASIQALWGAAHQSFALRSWVSENKFGPNRVVCRTPLSNIRITTFFAGEHEVGIIDPDRVDVVAAVDDLDEIWLHIARLVVTMAQENPGWATFYRSGGAIWDDSLAGRLPTGRRRVCLS